MSRARSALRLGLRPARLRQGDVLHAEALVEQPEALALLRDGRLEGLDLRLVDLELLEGDRARGLETPRPFEDHVGLVELGLEALDLGARLLDLLLAAARRHLLALGARRQDGRLGRRELRLVVLRVQAGEDLPLLDGVSLDDVELLDAPLDERRHEDGVVAGQLHPSGGREPRGTSALGPPGHPYAGDLHRGSPVSDREPPQALEPEKGPPAPMAMSRSATRSRLRKDGPRRVR